jgi:hypothetical protein
MIFYLIISPSAAEAESETNGEGEKARVESFAFK